MIMIFMFFAFILAAIVCSVFIYNIISENNSLPNKQDLLINNCTCETSFDSDHSVTIFDNKKYGNMRFSAAILLTQGNHAGIIFNAQNIQNYYEFYINSSESVVELWLHTDGNRNMIRKLHGYEINNNIWYQLEVSVNNRIVACSLNGIEVIKDIVSIHKDGYIGFSSYYHGAKFKDLKVSA